MRKLIDVFILLCLFCGAAFGQAVNPQNTFANAVNAASPSLWLNFNDPTASFKDQVSGSAFLNTGSKTVTSAMSAGPNCYNGSSSTSTLSCTLTATASDTLVVFVGGVTGGITSVTDSLGATAVLIGSSSPTWGFAYYFANVAAGSHTITVTLPAAIAYPTIQVFDAVGASITSPVDTFGFNLQTTSTKAVTSGPVTTTHSGDLLIGNTYAYDSGGGESFSPGVPAFTLAWSSFQDTAGGTLVAGAAGSYTFNLTATTAYGWGTWIVALKPKVTTSTYTSGTVATQQPGFDSTNPQQYSAAFPWNGFSAAPNNTLGSMDWDLPWTMLLHIDRLNWDRVGTLTLASKGDGTFTGSWGLTLQAGASGTGTGTYSKLCFGRYAPPTETGQGYAASSICTDNYYDAMPNGFNYDIVVEDSGTGQPSSLSMWINGSGPSSPSYAGIIPVTAASGSYQYGFDNVDLKITAGGTGYAASTGYTSTGGGANCTVTGIANATSGVIASLSQGSNTSCTSNPTIVLTNPTGSGAVITATASPQSFNSTAAPLMVPGYVSNGVYYGAGGTDATQNPVNIDEFAIFPGNLTFGQITNIFYETKFYQGQLFPGIASNPPLVIFEGSGCGPDFSGDQTVAMVLGAARAGIIRLIGEEDDDGNANGSNSLAWWRQMLDQAGLADVPLSNGTGSFVPNLGGCPASVITGINASTPQNPSSYESAITMYRTLFAKYSTKPIYVLLTQTYNGYVEFLNSPADGISPLTGYQLQAQNAANGGWVNVFEGNQYTDPTDLKTLWTTNGAMPVWVPGGFGGEGGPGIIASRLATDPIYHPAAIGTVNPPDAVQGYTNQNLAQVLSPYFNGGVQVAYSGGTGYANTTLWNSAGGGPYCHASGIMTAASGVPNGIQTSWGSIIGAIYNGIGYGCTPATFTATGSGTNLTVSNVFGTITVGDTISGTGIPAGTTITGQTSGPTGGAGVYTTSVATTASAAAVTRQPTIVLVSPTGTGVTLTAAIGIFLNNYSQGATNTWTVWPSQYDQNTSTGGAGGASTAPIFSWFSNSLMDGPVNGRPAP